MHDSQRVLKASVHRARIDVICPGKLSDSAKPLKCWLGDYIPLPVVQTDEPVYWAADFVGTMRIQIVGASSIVGEQKEKVKLFSLRESTLSQAKLTNPRKLRLHPLTL